MSTHYNRRDWLQRTALMGGLAVLPRESVFARTSELRSANETLGVGIIGAGGRGNELAAPFSKAAGTKIVAVADPDAQRANKLAGKFDAKAYTDLREVFDDSAVDVVAIATCNHWHCLAAIWAMQAGKDVYVEKPLSHTQWEGRQVVRAARKYDRIVQVGTQQRSDPMQAEIKQYLHSDKALGEIQYVQANRLGVREPIGKRSEPLSIGSDVDMNLWTGPAAMQPLFRNSLHYDWHWDWNTGNGEMGNWGVHVLDDVRNVAYQDSVSTPKSLFVVGGRLVWNDAGETPNVHYAVFETESFPTYIALSNLPAAPDKPKSSWTSKLGRPQGGPGSGYVVVCEGGYFLGQRGRGKAIDRDGKTMQEFQGGDIVTLHVQNFLSAVREHRSDLLNAEVETGHYSTGWCNLANVGIRAASTPMADSTFVAEKPQVWGQLIEDMEGQLSPFGLDGESLSFGPELHYDEKTERFRGDGAENANRFLRRDYRSPFSVPEIA